MRLVLIVLLGVLAAPLAGESTASIQQRRADLFDPLTGYRIARQRAPTPDDIPPPATRIDAEAVARLIGEGALLLDVFGAQSSRFDELDGTWLVSKAHHSLPGAVWLPEVGRGRLSETMQDYLARNIARLRQGDRPVVVFCVADCWMSWNAAQRLAAMGVAPVFWFREGTDGWREAGRALHPVEPVPVAVD